METEVRERGRSGDKKIGESEKGERRRRNNIEKLNSLPEKFRARLTGFFFRLGGKREEEKGTFRSFLYSHPCMCFGKFSYIFLFLRLIWENRRVIGVGHEVKKYGSALLLPTLVLFLFRFKPDLAGQGTEGSFF